MIRRLPPSVALLVGAFVLLLGPATRASAPVAERGDLAGVRRARDRSGTGGVTEGYVAAPVGLGRHRRRSPIRRTAPVITSGAISLSASAVGSATALATASAQVNGLSLFGGELTVAAGRREGDGTRGRDERDRRLHRHRGHGPRRTALSASLLGDWGTVAVGSGSGQSATASDSRGWHGSVTALDVRLTADHGGLPAGTRDPGRLRQLRTSRAAVAPEPDVQDNEPRSVAGALQREERLGTAQRAEARHGRRGRSSTPHPKEPPISEIPNVHPQLTAGRYVFPVYGAVVLRRHVRRAARRRVAGTTATTSSPRSARRSSPSPTAPSSPSAGTTSAAGASGCATAQGNEFYYAHLSAYSPLARERRAACAPATVLGFVGNTGDAEGTPYHLHFEIHPVALLYLGYDGAVNPTPYLDAWQRLQDIRFSAAGRLAAGRSSALTPSRAPEPGAILLQVSDISSASGLDPARCGARSRRRRPGRRRARRRRLRRPAGERGRRRI